MPYLMSFTNTMSQKKKQFFNKLETLKRMMGTTATVIVKECDVIGLGEKQQMHWNTNHQPTSQSRCESVNIKEHLPRGRIFFSRVHLLHRSVRPSVANTLLFWRLWTFLTLCP